MHHRQGEGKHRRPLAGKRGLEAVRSVSASLLEVFLQVLLLVHAATSSLVLEARVLWLSSICRIRATFSHDPPAVRPADPMSPAVLRLRFPRSFFFETGLQLGGGRSALSGKGVASLLCGCYRSVFET